MRSRPDVVSEIMGILYGYMFAQFDAQQEKPEFYHAGGYMNFERFACPE